MDREIKKINTILTDLSNAAVKMEEEAVKNASFDDISTAEIHTLSAVGNGRPKTMTHVANILGVNVSTLTTAVNRLVKKGYVERLRDDTDRRIVKLRLTEKGSFAVEENEKFHEDLIREAISRFSDSQLRQFISSIDNITQFLTERTVLPCVRKESFRCEPIKLGPHLLPVPLVQAGMSIGVAGSELASSVAKQGGLGLIGTSELGYRSKKYDTDRMAANAEAVEREVSLARRRTEEAKGGGLIGASIVWGGTESAEYVAAALKGGAQVIVTSGGIPKDLPRYCTDKKTALIPTISSVRAASAIIKTWAQKYNRKPDGFIFQGPHAAGLLGFRKDQIYRAEEEFYMTIASVKAELTKTEDCPLIVGGGIFDRRDAEKAYKYGADGFLMGTRFVATRECDAPEEFKRLYLNCSEKDVTIIRSPGNKSVRAMKNSFTERLSCEPRLSYDLIEAVRRAMNGDFEDGLVFLSESVGRISSICNVEDIFREFTV